MKQLSGMRKAFASKGDDVTLTRFIRTGEQSRSKAKVLVRLVSLTPYSREDFMLAFKPCRGRLERARRLIVRSHMGYGTTGTRLDRFQGFRRDGKTGTTRVAGEWAEFPEVLAATVERLRGVSIECLPALQLVDYWDDPSVMLYLDPPYLPETRSGKAKRGEGYHTYGVEMAVSDHVELLDRARASSSLIIISGYPSELYDSMLSDWQRTEFRARTHYNVERIEVLWVNPAAVARLEAEACPLFAVA